MMYPKNKPFRSKKAIVWFRGHACVICGSTETCGHHEPLKGHGVGSKGPDDEQIPLCFVHHRERHDMGRYSFWERYVLIWEMLVEHWKNKLHSENPGWDK